MSGPGGDDAARREVLARIAAATDGARDADADAALAAVPRAYRQAGVADEAARLDRLEARLVDYGVDVVRIRRAGVADAIAGELRRRRARRVVAPGDAPAAWRAALEGFEIVADDEDADALDDADATLTGCAVAVAETGSIVLDGGPGQGRRAASLVPDLHVCVVAASQVVELVPDAVTRLADAAGRGAPITWISGPSATSDIELERVAGVHGPRTLVALLVLDA